MESLSQPGVKKVFTIGNCWVLISMAKKRKQQTWKRPVADMSNEEARPQNLFLCCNSFNAEPGRW